MINLDFKEEGMDFFEKSELISPLEKKVGNDYPDLIKRVFSTYSRRRTTIYALLKDTSKFEKAFRAFQVFYSRYG